MASTSAAVRQSVEAMLAHRIPGALTPAPRVLRPTLPTGVPVLDSLLGGGVPAGAVSELVGPASSGRTTLAIRLIAEALRTGGGVAAWVDVSATLDAEAAAANGIPLDRLLWVRCGAKRGQRTEVQSTRTVAKPDAPEQPLHLPVKNIARPYPNALRSDAPSGKVRRGVPAVAASGSAIAASGLTANEVVDVETEATSLLASSSEALLQVVPRAGATLPSGGCGSPHPRGEVRGLDTAIASLFASPRMGARIKPGTPSAPNLLLGDAEQPSVSHKDLERYEPATKVDAEGRPIDVHARMWSAPHRSHQKVQPAIQHGADSPFSGRPGPAAPQTVDAPFFAAKPDCEQKRPTASPFTLRKGGTSSGPKTIAQLIAAKARISEDRRTDLYTERPSARQAVPQHEQVPSDRQPSRRACYHAMHDPLRCPRCASAAEERAAAARNPAARNTVAHTKEATDIASKPPKDQVIGLHLESNSLPSELPANFPAAKVIGGAKKPRATPPQSTSLERIDQALRTTDLLLQGGGFRVLVLDLGSISAEHASRIPLATWFRFRSLAESTQCALVVLLQHDCAKSAAELVLRLRPAANLCGKQRNANAPRHTSATMNNDTIFCGLRFTAEVLRRRFENQNTSVDPNPMQASKRSIRSEQEQNNVVSMRKPPGRAMDCSRSAAWSAQMAWAVARAMPPAEIASIATQDNQRVRGSDAAALAVTPIVTPIVASVVASIATQQQTNLTGSSANAGTFVMPVASSTPSAPEITDTPAGIAEGKASSHHVQVRLASTNAPSVQAAPALARHSTFAKQHRSREGLQLLHGLEHVATAMRSRELAGRTGAGL